MSTPTATPVDVVAGHLDDAAKSIEAAIAAQGLVKFDSPASFYRWAVSLVHFSEKLAHAARLVSGQTIVAEQNEKLVDDVAAVTPVHRGERIRAVLGQLAAHLDSAHFHARGFHSEAAHLDTE